MKRAESSGGVVGTSFPHGVSPEITEEATRLIEYLTELIPRNGDGATTHAIVDRWLGLDDLAKIHDLPSLYLVLEQYIVRVDPRGDFETDDLRKRVVSRCPRLASHPFFGLILAPLHRQEVNLARLFLHAVLEEIEAFAGTSLGGPFEQASRWLENLHLEGGAPKDDDESGDDLERMEMISHLSREVFNQATRSIGRSSIEKIYEETFARLEESYAELESFPAVIRLMPEILLDEHKVAILNHDQMQRVFLEKVDQLQWMNEILTQKNQVLKETEEELRRIKGELENRVDQRTRELQQTNEGLIDEIMQRRKAEDALKASEERYALAARGANDGLWDWDLLSNHVYFSQRWKEMLGWGTGETHGTPDDWWTVVHPDDLSGLQARLSLHLRGATQHFEHEYRARHANGSWRWMLCRGVAVRSEDETPYRIAGSQTDITLRKAVEEQLIHDAFHDTMTGLPNRALFLDRLGSGIARARRRKSAYAVLFLDIDRFKVVNDSLGHRIGDRLLIEIAERLKSALREGDTLARLGGDEFAILVDEMKSPDEATLVACRIREALDVAFQIDGHEIFASASIGVATGKHDYDRADEVLRDADTAMYRAKAAGRGRHVLFDENMRQIAIETLQIETDLRRALDREEFRLHYQPIVDLESESIVGFEALLRWEHPVRGVIMPDTFIPLAEETGLIVPIGSWVMREACRQLAEWKRHEHVRFDLSVSVNLSAKQIASESLVDEVSQVLIDTGIDAGSLALEITETAIIENADSAATVLGQLRDLGVRLHIDDFGTGYSSLSYLNRYPVETLKIDRSFVGRIGPEDGNLELVRTIIALAHVMGMRVIAEGVESLEQRTLLGSLGCEFGQGYFYARPHPPTFANELLAAPTGVFGPPAHSMPPTEM